MGLVLLIGAGLAAVPGSDPASASTTDEVSDLAIVADRSDQPFPAADPLRLDRWHSPSGTDSRIEVRGVEQVRGVEPSNIATPTEIAVPATTVPGSTAVAITNPPTTAPPTTAPPTTAPPTTATPSPPTALERGTLALSRISYPWNTALPGWTITFEAGRSGVFGFTYVQERRIEVFVRDDQSDALLAHVVAHEIGHAVDVSRNDENDRLRWQQVRGIENVPWWPGNGLTDFSTGAGDFAEAFAVWQVGPGSYRSRVASAPTAEQLAVMAELAS